MIIETSWDDNGGSNFRLAKLLKKYGVPAVFYLPFEGIHDELVKELFRLGFEIGGHTVTHPQDLKILPFEKKYYEINTGKSMLEGFLGREVRKFAYPRGRFDQECVRLVKEAGYDEARTVKVLAESPGDSFRKATSIHFFDRKEYKGRPVLLVAKDIFDRAFNFGSLGWFHLWGHAWELDRYNLWDYLEEFLTYMETRLHPRKGGLAS